jgi:glycine oxidase ThiO
LIVAGAGIIGLSCAWGLARGGRHVTVFDRSKAASEASWAGAGMLAPGGEFDSDSPLLRMALRSLELYPRFIRELEEESGIAIDFRRCGAIEVGPIDFLKATSLRRLSMGIHSEACEYRGQPARFYPGDAAVDPRRITQALLAACRARGVAIHENEAVIRVAEDGGSIESAAGRYEGEGVIIAAGAWSSGLYPNLPPCRPVRGHLVGWQMPPGFLGPIVRHNGTYILQRSSGLLIAGSSSEDAGFERTLDENVIADIERRAAELVPELRDITPVERWNGLRPAVEGERPLIGRIPGTAVFTAFGHYRNGILLAPETARLIAELIC